MRSIAIKPIDESLDYILAHQCSVARFGDGEMDLIAGHSIPYQVYDEQLAAQLRQIMGQASSENLLVCLSDVFEGRERYNSNFSFFWDGHLERFGHLYEEICQAPWYGSTFISRPYIDLADKAPAAGYFAKLKSLWQDRDILIVEGETSRSGVGNDLFAQAKSVARIICPSKNAYAQYDEIAQAIRQYGKDKLVLLMLGPTAKVLAANLSQAGLWLIDIGHIDSEYEWFLMGADHKVKFSHKHTAEHNHDEGLVLATDGAYEQEIICRLNQPLISVIVPVYNVAAYLEECLRSILNQTYTKLEVLLIDDGSTDGSSDICDRYANQDGRIRVIRQANAGLSQARNRGIEEAKGAYLFFVDSDDAINEAVLAESYQQVVEQGADVVITNFFQYSELENVLYYYADKASWGQAEVVSRQEAVDRQSHWGHLNTATFVSTWAKLYKKSLFDQVRFPVGRVHEDEYTTHKLFLRADKIVFLNKDYYLYRRRAGSVMTATYHSKQAEDYIKAMEERLLDLTLAGLDTTVTLNKYRAVLAHKQEELSQHQLTDSDLYRYILEKRDLLGE